MGFTWTEEKIMLYKRASEYTLYNTKLGEKILPYIDRKSNVFDIGCGLSYLSIYLSQFIKEIHCIDTDENIIYSFMEEIKKRKIENIKLYLSDYKDILDGVDNIDCIIASHFLDINQELEYLLSKTKQLIIIKNIRKTKGLYKLEKQKIEDVEDLLIDKKIKYEKFIHTGDFGQPLKSIEESIRYYNSYTGEYKNEKDLKNIIEIRNYIEYPYYIPKNKSTGVIIINNYLINEY